MKKGKGLQEKMPFRSPQALKKKGVVQGCLKLIVTAALVERQMAAVRHHPALLMF